MLVISPAPDLLRRHGSQSRDSSRVLPLAGRSFIFLLHKILYLSVLLKLSVHVRTKDYCEVGHFGNL